MQLPVPAGEPIYTGRGCDSPDKVNPVSALRSSLIHLNNAGSALPSTHTLSTQVDYLIRESQIGGYEAFTEYADDLHAVHAQVGALVNCPSEQVALVESATVGWDRALQAIAHDDPLEPGDRILVASSEYASNVIPLMQLANKTGAQLEFIPDGPDGGVDVEAFAGTLDERVRIVSITHAPSHNGVVNDIVGIGDACALMVRPPGTSWMPASRRANFRWISRASAVTHSLPPAVSSSAGPEARVSSPPRNAC